MNKFFLNINAFDIFFLQNGHYVLCFFFKLFFNCVNQTNLVLWCLNCNINELELFLIAVVWMNFKSNAKIYVIHQNTL